MSSTRTILPTLSASRCLLLITISCVVAILSGCAPVQQGNDQSKDFNVNLVELKDAKYNNLPQAEGGLSAAMRDEIDAKVLEWMASEPVPIAGCAIAITRDDKIVYLHAYGDADTDTGRDFTIATPSAIGSISKTLTALGLMVLVEDGKDENGNGEGKLNLDEPLLDQLGLIPGVDTGWTDNPTLRDVLAHKGGFIKGTQPVWGATFSDGPTMAAVFPGVDFPSLQPVLVFQGYKSESGNQKHSWLGTPKYSNVGYSVAGTLLDARSMNIDIPANMRGYERFIWHRVARGLSGTEPTMITAALTTNFRTADIKNLAKGYAEDGSPLSFDDNDSVGWGWEGPSGGWSMTIGDLARLMLIMQSDAVIKKTVINSEMRFDYGQLFNDGTRAGLGLELDQHAKWFGKGGDVLGYTADFKIWPSSQGPDWGVAFLCNQTYAGKQLTGQLKEIVSPSIGGQTGGGQAQGGRQSPAQSRQEVSDPLVELAKQYEPLIRQLAQRYMTERTDPAEAWIQIKRDLATYPNATQLIDALERGELSSALRLLPRVAHTDGAPAR